MSNAGYQFFWESLHAYTAGMEDRAPIDAERIKILEIKSMPSNFLSVVIAGNTGFSVIVSKNIISSSIKRGGKAGCNAHPQHR
jgi:hypothetical protein